MLSAQYSYGPKVGKLTPISKTYLFSLIMLFRFAILLYNKKAKNINKQLQT
jgi:hypothetical protein